jgi:putative selenate reductase
MPADHEEKEAAAKDGILFRELLSPVAIKSGMLVCEEMKLGERDASGRRSPVPTGNNFELDADTVIVAVGEKVDSDLLRNSGIEIDSKGFPKVNNSLETNIENVYVAGDVKKGPATIVKAMADGKTVTRDILHKEGLAADFDNIKLNFNEEALYNKKGILADPVNCESEAERCLACNTICELCVDVCPNRANVVINVPDNEGFSSSHQIVHLDGMCNECGNCGIFCPHQGNPYKDKITIFWSEEDFLGSTNKGFYVIDSSKGLFKVRTENDETVTYKLGQENQISKEMAAIVRTFVGKYNYMI